MKVILISNYLNHHQLPLCLGFHKLLGEDFKFVATTRLPRFRAQLGYPDLNDKYDFVVKTYESDQNKAIAKVLCDDADAVIIGSAPRQYIEARLSNRKLTFFYSERIFKKKMRIIEWPARLVKYFYKYGRYKNIYLLCASAYSAADFAKTGAFLNRAYKWGYFPEVEKYDDSDKLVDSKEKRTLLWVGRLINWKHPELPIKVAKKLKDDGMDFQLNIIGNGQMENELKKLIEKYDLQNNVKMLGSMSPEKVREYMEESEIYLFTSDRQEGWGAVLNEAMNSGCAVVASHIIGSVPFLIKDGDNGLIYRDGDIESLYNKVKFLLDNPEKCDEIGRKAYQTMVNEWNGKNAAGKFIKLAKEILKGNKKPDLFDGGVCSKAKILKDWWYK